MKRLILYFLIVAVCLVACRFSVTTTKPETLPGPSLGTRKKPKKIGPMDSRSSCCWYGELLAPVEPLSLEIFEL